MSAAANETRRPRVIEAAFVLVLLAVAADTVMWTLETFFISPTGLAELREEMGASGARRQVAVSAGFLVVTNAALLVCGFMMRQGHRWARIVLTGLGVLVLFSVIDSANMNGFGPGSVTGDLYDFFVGASPVILAAVAVLLMFLPAANRYFSPAARTR